MGIIYFIVILGASIIGAIVGLGGGVIIRPVFDAIGYHNVLNIGFFSSVSIFTMAIISTIKKIQDGSKIDVKIVLLISIGSLLGGTIGGLILEYFVYMLPRERDVQVLQIIVNIIVLVVAIIATRNNHLRYNIKNKLWCIPIGICLGIIAAFLGIGGGAINVPLFMILFGLSIKDSTTYSIVIIFTSHLSRLITMGITIGYSYFDVGMLVFVIPAAALGGLIGAKFSKILSQEMIKKMFMVAMICLIFLNLFNWVFII